MSAGLGLGVPGVYRAPEQPNRTIVGARLDVTGFAGITARGPVDEPVAVETWSAYVRRFGGLDPACPGLLSPAVAAYFDQGGARAHIVRVGPPADPQARARHRLADTRVTTAAGPVELTARDEGRWGDQLTVRLSFRIAQQFSVGPDGISAGEDQNDVELALPQSVPLSPGTLLRIRGPQLPAAGLLRWVRPPNGTDGHHRNTEHPNAVRLERWRPDGDPGRLTVAVVSGVFTVLDTAPDYPRSEEFSGLGLHPDHPRWLARVLNQEATWVRAEGPWTAEPLLLADPLLEPVGSDRVHDGRDRYPEITAADFFDADFLDAETGGPVGDPLDERPHQGVDALVQVEELGLLVVPDLFWNGVAAPDERTEPEERRTASSFEPCRAPDPALVYHRPGLGAVLLDAVADAEEIVRRQSELVRRAEQRQRFVVLLDLPPGMPVDAVRAWRSQFDSSYAAAYHPWLAGARSDASAPAPTERLVFGPASGFAAGIVAARELRRGLAWGPANELAVGAIAARDSITPGQHETLFGQSVNVFLPERDGFRLSSARTLSRQRDYQQLSVRRVMTMLRLSLQRELHWLVFEPHTEELRRLLVITLTTFLRGWYQAGAFAGNTEAEAFFVHCDAVLNPPADRAQGRLITEIGVAPAAPVEFLVLRLSLEAGGVLELGERNR